jgi:hypothetical protein
MGGMILAHAGGLDELAIVAFPAIVGLGVWLLTRQPNQPKKKLESSSGAVGQFGLGLRGGDRAAPGSSSP